MPTPDPDVLMPPHKPKFDVSTPTGRRRALWDMTWSDHAFLRVWWTNEAWISDEMVRTNQPWPFQIRKWAKRGVKTVINLRGGIHTSFHALERQTCEELGLSLVNFTLESRGAPKPADLHRAKALFDEIAYPALMHCKSGADRAGLASVLYLHFRKGVPIDEARKQLSLRFGHVRQGKTGILDYFFDRYLAEGAPKGLSLLDWADTAYDPKELKHTFLSSWWANVLVDRVLRRE
jgi:protein tyrosine/serine phosphatase